MTWVMDALEYLVLKAMAGKPAVLKALREQSEGSLSPSEAETHLGVSRHQLRGFKQRLCEKTGSAQLADTLIKLSVPIILSKVPSKVDGGWPPRCMICNAMISNVFPEDHIKKSHYDELRRHVRIVAAELKSSLSKKTQPQIQRVTA